jgi:hypothetical protein
VKEGRGAGEERCRRGEVQERIVAGCGAMARQGGGRTLREREREIDREREREREREIERER